MLSIEGHQIRIQLKIHNVDTIWPRYVIHLTNNLFNHQQIDWHGLYFADKSKQTTHSSASNVVSMFCF